MSNSASPNKTSAPRFRHHLNNSHIIEQLTATMADSYSYSYYAMAENAESQNIKAIWDTQTQSNTWAYKNVSDNETNISEMMETNDNTNKKTNSVFDQINILTNVRKQLAAIRNFLEHTPETEEEYQDEPLLPVDDIESLRDEFGYGTIPEYMLCDEGASFNYNNVGDYQIGYVDAALIENADYDDINPSTSKRALEKLFILQTSAWMKRPNIDYESPNDELIRSITAANRQERQQIRLSYSSITL